MNAYSTDLRTRVLAACDAGQRTKAVAATFRVSPAWVRRLKQHRRERGGDVAPRTGGGSRGRKIDRGRLADLVRQQPDATRRSPSSATGSAWRSPRGPCARPCAS